MSQHCPPTTPARWAAWSVHFYTATGLVLALLAIDALIAQDLRALLIWMMAATFVDATDGTLARRVDVRRVTPQFDGRKLDDIVDYLNFAFVPCLAFFQLDVLPPDHRWVAILPLLASGYGRQDRAKTEDAFVGFPSYWNVLLAYFLLIPTPPNMALAILVVPAARLGHIHYVYPTKTRLLRSVTPPRATSGLAAWCTFPPTGRVLVPKAALISLAYPAYYLVISLIHHRQVMGHRHAQARACWKPKTSTLWIDSLEEAWRRSSSVSSAPKTATPGSLRSACCQSSRPEMSISRLFEQERTIVESLNHPNIVQTPVRW